MPKTANRASKSTLPYRAETIADAKLVSNVVRFCQDCLEALRDDDDDTVRLQQRANARLKQERWLEYLSG